MRLNRIVVVGSLNMDLVVKTAHLPKVGETTSGQELHTIPGGKGANQAVAAGKLGAQVFLVGRVGQDGFGHALLENLKAEGVDTSCVEKLAGVSTGVALITVDEGGDNTIVVVPGANGECDPEFVSRALNQLTGDVLIVQLEIPAAAVEAAITVAKKKGMMVILNPAPAIKLARELLQADMLVLNETETEVITDMKVTDAVSAVLAGRKLVNMGIDEVVITLGRQGAVYVSDDGELNIPSFPVTSVDATAAGDAFIGSLAAFINRTENMESALTIASAAGALAVMKLGAQSSLPTMQDLVTFLRQNGRGDIL